MVLIDDVLISSHTIEQGPTHWETILKLFNEVNHIYIIFNLKKYNFQSIRIKFLRLKISEGIITSK